MAETIPFLRRVELYMFSSASQTSTAPVDVILGTVILRDVNSVTGIVK